jgi:hypothetical protein
MEQQFNTITHGARHGAPSKEADVARLAAAYLKSDLHKYEAGRKIKNPKDRSVDFVTKGAIDLK